MAKSRTILVIEDEEPVRAVARSILEGVGYEVVTADDGREGLQALRDAPNGFDLVLLDMTKPHLGGDEVLERIRQTHPELPVILCSGYNQIEDAEGWLDENASAFIPKPFGPMELLETVRHVLHAQ